METTLYSTFLDDKEIAYQIYEMLANDILGKEQLEKIKFRYDDMYRNFFNYSKEEAGKLIKSGTEACVWEFSKGVEPFTPKGWNRYYEDTITSVLSQKPRGRYTVGTVIMKTLLPCLYQ